MRARRAMKRTRHGSKNRGMVLLSPYYIRLLAGWLRYEILVLSFGNVLAKSRSDAMHDVVIHGDPVLERNL